MIATALCLSSSSLQEVLPTGPSVTSDRRARPPAVEEDWTGLKPQMEPRAGPSEPQPCGPCSVSRAATAAGAQPRWERVEDWSMWPEPLRSAASVSVWLTQDTCLTCGAWTAMGVTALYNGLAVGKPWEQGVLGSEGIWEQG